MIYATHLNAASLAREAERLTHMARHAADCPAGYNREAWASRCMRLARDYAAMANRLDS